MTTGAKSKSAIHGVVGIVFEELAALGISAADAPEITVQNIVSTTDLGQPLNLNAIAIGFGLANVEYGSEQFPGLVYRINAPAVATLLLGSSKLVITDQKTPGDAPNAVEAVSARLDDLSPLE